MNRVTRRTCPIRTCPIQRSPTPHACAPTPTPSPVPASAGPAASACARWQAPVIAHVFRLPSYTHTCAKTLLVPQNIPIVKPTSPSATVSGSSGMARYHGIVKPRLS